MTEPELRMSEYATALFSLRIMVSPGETHKEDLTRSVVILRARSRVPLLV